MSMMAEIFNNFDRQTESRFITALEERNRESAERIRALMFTFEDLAKLDPGSIQTLLRDVEKDKLGLALKGASDGLRDVFFSNMSERAGKIMREDMEAMGPVRLKDVDEAQMRMVQCGQGPRHQGRDHDRRRRRRRRADLLMSTTASPQIHLRHRVPRRAAMSASEAARARQKQTLTTEEVETMCAKARGHGRRKPPRCARAGTSSATHLGAGDRRCAPRWTRARPKSRTCAPRPPAWRLPPPRRSPPRRWQPLPAGDVENALAPGHASGDRRAPHHLARRARRGRRAGEPRRRHRP